MNLFRHFWILLLLSAFLNTFVLRRRLQQTGKSPEEIRNLTPVLRGYSWGITLPWVSMGLGAVVGGIPTPFHFLILRPLNPWVLPFQGTMVLLYIALFRWIWFRGGAEFLQEHRDIFFSRNPLPSPQLTRIIVALLPLGWVAAVIFLSLPRN